MIKRIRFATRAAGVSEAAFAIAWPDAVAGAAQAPSAVRPLRVAASTTLPELTGPDRRHDGTGVEWFADVGHLELFEKWLASPDAAESVRKVSVVADQDTSPVVVAEESVQRGPAWLEERWRDGGEKLKHMAIAVRAAGLSPEEFSRRWRGHAGQAPAGPVAQTVVIPEEVRGLGYVQNHPVPRTSGEWAYDALSEVYFDDVAGLRARIDWFRENVPAPADGELFGQSWFIAAREVVLA